MNHLDLIEDYISSEKQYLANYLLSQKATYFSKPLTTNLLLDKIGYTADLISQLSDEQKAGYLLSNILEKEGKAIYEAANLHLGGIAQARAALNFELIQNAAYPYTSNLQNVNKPPAIKRGQSYERRSSHTVHSTIVEAKSQSEKPLAVDHNRLNRIAEHEKHLAELKENTRPIMEIRQIVFLLMPDIDANQEREALAKAIIKSIKYGYLKLEWVQDKEGFIHKPFHQQILASIHVNDFTHCANAGWLGEDAPALALQWHSYLVKPKSALPISSESNPDDHLKRRAKQVEALLKVIEKMNMNPQALNVGGGNKKKIHDACICEYSQLFTSSIHTFNGIWQAALKKGVLKITENSRAKDKGS